jgi:hypothetical protein
MAKAATVDIERIESEIQEKAEAIDLLIREKEILEGILLYAAANPLNGHKTVRAKPVKPVKRAKRVKAVKVAKTVKRRSSTKVRISDYLENLVGKAEIGTRDAVLDYANHLGSTYEAVYNSVNNALARLKKSDSVTYRLDEEGNRLWSKK